MNDTFSPSRFDAVIVLANLMDINGNLNFESAARAKKAVELFNTENIPHLVTCGWAYRQDSKIIIAEAFKHYISNELGIDSKYIITEHNSRDTVGDAYFTKINISAPRSWKKLLVITSDYHVERTKEIFGFIYGPEYTIEVIGAHVTHNNSAMDNELKSTEAFRENFLGINKGDDMQILNRLRERHPYYNGKIYEKI